MTVPDAVVRLNPADALVKEYIQNKQAADECTARNREIAKQFEQLAVFKEGSDTGSLNAAGVRVKVTRRENVTWHADKIEELRALLGDDGLFTMLFKWKYQPRSMKDFDAFLAGKYSNSKVTPAQLQAVIKTRNPGLPGIAIEELQ